MITTNTFVRCVICKIIDNGETKPQLKRKGQSSVEKGMFFVSQFLRGRKKGNLSLPALGRGQCWTLLIMWPKQPGMLEGLEGGCGNSLVVSHHEWWTRCELPKCSLWMVWIAQELSITQILGDSHREPRPSRPKSRGGYPCNSFVRSGCLNERIKWFRSSPT